MHVYKCVSVQMWKCASMHICTYTRMEVFMFASMQVCKYTSVHMSNVQMLKYENLLVSNIFFGPYFFNLSMQVCDYSDQTLVLPKGKPKGELECSVQLAKYSFRGGGGQSYSDLELSERGLGQA